MEQPAARGPLAARTCIPCRGGVEPLSGESLEALSRQLGPGWAVPEGRRLEREFRFRNFRQAMAFANAIAAVAEEQKHHPDLTVGWGRLVVSLYTHTIGGLHENDFIMAAKIDALPQPDS